jgi:geranylgeranyl diphosphate synthase type I
MFVLAQMALLRLSETISPHAALQSFRVFQDASIALTQGQYLDLAYEARGDLTLEAYWPMVSGKTAALLSACTMLGALAADAAPGRCDAYQRFGRLLGLAFQAQDDLLGIWGNAALTGKSAESDLLAGKKTLPVLYSLEQHGSFYNRWMGDPILPDEVPALAAQLEAEGARKYAQGQASSLTRQALDALEEASPQGEAGAALIELAQSLLGRQG